jgi:predicted dehydrogenase
VAHTFLDYTEMLALPELDAVSVCTPNKFHCQPTVDALEAGKHVIVEKPMARNAEECQRMIDAAKANDRVLMCGFQWRFDPKSQFIKKQIEGGIIGDVMHARVHALRRRLVPSWGVFGNLELQGGGAMIDMGVHILEMAHFLMGSPKPVAVSGQTFLEIANKPNDVLAPWGDWDHETWQSEDLATGYVRFDNGATMHIESSFVAHIEKEDNDVVIMGKQGGARFSEATVFTNQNGYMVDTKPAYLGKDDGFSYKMRHFVDCCRNGTPCEASGEDGRAVQQILDGLYASAKAGREITL